MLALRGRLAFVGTSSAQGVDNSERSAVATLGNQQAGTLQTVLRRLGGSVLSAAYAPDSDRVLVTEPVLYDVEEPVPAVPHGILLLVGCAPDDAGLAAVVTEAKDQGYTAVAVKPRGRDLTDLVHTAEELGIGLLVAADGMPWRHLDSMISAATGVTTSAGHPYDTYSVGDLFALANAIASTVGGAITIEDHTAKVLAHSNVPGQEVDDVRRLTILGRYPPDRPHNAEEYRRVQLADGVVRFSLPDEGHADRLAIAVRAGDSVIGFIWVIDGMPPLKPDAEAFLVEAAKVAALHIVSARSRKDLERSHRADILRGLLVQGGGGLVAAQIGLQRDTPTRVIALAQAAETREPGLTAGRIVDLVNLHCQTWHRESLCAGLRGIVYGLLPVKNAHDESQILAFGRSVVEAVRSTLHIDMYCAIGPPVPRLDDAPTSREAADRLLELLPGTSGDGVATATMLRSRLYLASLVDRGVLNDGSLLGPVADMLEYDAQHGTDYATSVRAYFDCLGNVSLAADVLTVHENTVRYRLRRVTELFGLDLDDPDERLVTWLQLRLTPQGGSHQQARPASTSLTAI